jgi:hypothetical protein
MYQPKFGMIALLMVHVYLLYCEVSSKFHIDKSSNGLFILSIY